MSRDVQKQKLLKKLTRGMAYTGPMVAVVMGASAFNVAAAEVTAEAGYMMLAAGEAEAEGEARSEGEAEGEGEGEAEGEGEGEGEGEAEGAAEA